MQKPPGIRRDNPATSRASHSSFSTTAGSPIVLAKVAHRADSTSSGVSRTMRRREQPGKRGYGRKVNVVKNVPQPNGWGTHSQAVESQAFGIELLRSKWHLRAL